MIQTPRLTLRVWNETDLAELIRTTNTEPVMRHLGGVTARAEFEALHGRIMISQEKHGFCFWIVERQDDKAVLGICGFKRGTVDPVMGEMEIGWRLREDAWGQGYAREAAGACLDWAWAHLDCPRIFAITVIGNAPSWKLMERLGMRRRSDMDFDHPNYPADHPLAPHITYMIERPA